MAQYRNIKIKPETFERLKEDKPDGVSWDYFISELHRKASAWEERGDDVL